MEGVTVDPAAGAETVEHMSQFNDGSMVVVFVLGIIMLGLFAFMFMIERKLARVEKNIEND